MSEEQDVYEVDATPKKRGRRAATTTEVTEPTTLSNPKISEGIHFGLDNTAAVVICCRYSQRREYAERLFADRRGVNGLTLTVPACGSSITYQGADRIPLGWNQCGCHQHSFVKWMEVGQ